MVQVREKWGKKMQWGERIMLKQKLGLELKMPVFLITLESLLMVLKYIKKCQRGCAIKFHVILHNSHLATACSPETSAMKRHLN